MNLLKNMQKTVRSTRTDRVPDDFAVFILTHGRPDNVKTYRTLHRCNYTGKIYFIVDDLDNTVDRYIENFGKDRVIIFDKKAEAGRTDSADTQDDMRTITYARNACYGIARSLGLKYFVQLDDDYVKFDYRFDDKRSYNPIVCYNIEPVFASVLRFYIKSGATSVALSQGGDFIGGSLNAKAGRIKTFRKCMNSFFCSVDRPLRFLGRMNEDVNTYTSLGARGTLFFTINHISLTQTISQSNEGGITELYKKFGTYVKSCYTIMHHPSGTKIRQIGNAKETMRIHHEIRWKHTVPKILREDVRKPR